MENHIDECAVEAPRYRCHKEVCAFKISKIHMDDNHDWIITPVESGYLPLHVSDEYIFKHRPKVGGYYVVYKDGYRSYSPPEVFEEGYTRI
jgi:hypothetical protein